MRKLIFQMLISIDGCFEGPGGELGWHRIDREFNEYMIDLLNTVDLLLLGKNTYELMASYWHTETAFSDDPVVAARVNALQKLVFSSTLPAAGWKNTKLVKEDSLAAISCLKKQPGKDLLIVGSDRLAQSCMAAGLIDEYRIIINPVILGEGNALFGGIGALQSLKLNKTRTFDSGNVLLYYQPYTPQQPTEQAGYMQHTFSMYQK